MRPHPQCSRISPPMPLAPMIVMAGFRNHADTLTTSAHDKRSKTEASPSTSRPVEPPDLHIYRCVAIALSVILALILVAIACSLYLYITHKRQADLERQTAAEANMGRITWRRSGAASTEETTGRAKSSSVFKHIPHPHLHRKDSVTTSALGDHAEVDATGGDAKRIWPSLSLWQSHDSVAAATPPPSTAFDCPSIYADTLPFSSDERPAPTHHFRLQSRKTFPEPSLPRAQFRLQSRKTFPEVSHPVAQSRLQSRKSLPEPRPLASKSRSQTTLPRRNSSLSQSQYDKQWWSEVGRRGSATAATRRLSVLEPVLEHDVRSHSCESRRAIKPEASRKNEKESSRRCSTSSTHASWEGSRCESVMYDWTRPTDEEVRSKSGKMTFKGVNWNQSSSSSGRGRQQERAECREIRDDSVYRMDWASKM